MNSKRQNPAQYLRDKFRNNLPGLKSWTNEELKEASQQDYQSAKVLWDAEDDHSETFSPVFLNASLILLTFGYTDTLPYILDNQPHRIPDRHFEGLTNEVLSQILPLPTEFLPPTQNIDAIREWYFANHDRLTWREDEGSYHLDK